MDGSRPWYAAIAAGLPLLESANPRAALSRAAAQRAIVTESGQPVSFVADDDAPPGRAYESHVAATGRVPTRLNAHDLLNALVWLAFPRSKARLNALQAAVIERDGVGARRGPLRDAATVFDENGALLVTEDINVPRLLERRHWQDLFVRHRAAWDGVRVLCFGHALIDKLASPYASITAHTLPLECPAQAPLPAIDAALADRLDAHFARSALLPLPVLGVPGWWPANAHKGFYDDGAVFRPAARHAAVQSQPRHGLAGATGPWR